MTAQEMCPWPSGAPKNRSWYRTPSHFATRRCPPPRIGKMKSRFSHRFPILPYHIRSHNHTRPITSFLKKFQTPQTRASINGGNGNSQGQLLLHILRFSYFMYYQSTSRSFELIALRVCKCRGFFFSSTWSNSCYHTYAWCSTCSTNVRWQEGALLITLNSYCT